MLPIYSSLPDSTELIDNGTANGRLAMVVGSNPLHAYQSAIMVLASVKPVSVAEPRGF